MDFIIDAIVEWLKGLLVDGIMGNLDGLFDNVNQSVGEIATQVGTTPADWNAGVFSMIRQISETAILPIAGVILTFVMTYELIQMLIERNNLHEVDTWMFFKWVFKTFVAVMILTNTFNIVLAVFDVSQHVIQQSAGIIQNGTEITPDVLDSLRTELEAMELGPLFGLWLQSFLIQLTMIALNIVIFVIVYCVAIWKMLRKKGCVPSALTQNVKDFLASPEIENIFENSDFLVLLSQAQGDRQILAKQLGISPHQLSYVTHTNSGEGLLFFGNTTIPFVDRFPQNTELYAIMTTRPEDKKQEMDRA